MLYLYYREQIEGFTLTPCKGDNNMKNYIPEKCYEVKNGIKYAIFWAEQTAVNEARHGRKYISHNRHSTVLDHRIKENERRTGEPQICRYVYTSFNRRTKAFYHGQNFIG